MAARRQSSHSSLSRYTGNPDQSEYDNPGLEFCNNFWGVNDAGVEVLFARMRIASKTVDDLRNFWRERAFIEDDYAKRLVKLSKQSLGSGEVGELKNALEVIRQETERQAGQHLSLSIAIKRELEGPVIEFVNKQAVHRKNSQAQVEKVFKQKQMNETHLAKAKERYEQDCHRVNAYTAQQTLVQGRDLEKVIMKLERAQSTVEQNKRDYQNFTKVLAETITKWDKEWKNYCDTCQDMEEERLEFMKDNVWAYANAVSTVCVNEDESCEAMRVALERLEVDKDIEFFITNHGTGADIPEPPPFINYTSAEPTPLRPITRPANFERQSNRPQSMMAKIPAAPQQEEEPIGAGAAGIGAGASHSRGNSYGQLYENGQPATQRGTSPHPDSAPQLPPIGGSAPNLNQHYPSNSLGSVTSPYSMPAMSNASTGSNKRGSYQQSPPTNNGPSSEFGFSKDLPPAIGGAGDPLMEQLSRLREGGLAESVRRGNTVGRSAPQSHQPPSSNQGSSYRSPSPLPAAASALSPPGTRGSVNYHSQAEAIVGAHPASRPSSPALQPAAPHAAMMQRANSRSRSPVPVEEVLNNYHQAFPAERRASRSNSFNAQNAPNAPRGRTMEQRPVSPGGSGGFAGIGAQGRSPSPQPFRQGTSPAPGSGPASGQQAQHNHTGSINDRRAISPAMGGLGAGGVGVSVTPSGSLRRTASPGITLDSSGNVIQDTLAEQYRRSSVNYGQPPSQQQQQQPPIAAPIPHPYASQQQPGGYWAPPPVPSNAQQGPPSNSAGYPSFAPPSVPPPPNVQQNVYNANTQNQPGMGMYGQPAYAPPGSQPPYNQPPQHMQQAPPAQQQSPYNQQQPIPPLAHSSTGSMSSMSSIPSMTYSQTTQQSGYRGPGYGGSPQPTTQAPAPAPRQPPPQQQQITGQGFSQGNNMPPPPQSLVNGRGALPAQVPSGPGGAPPTNNYIDDQGILFYVRALYDYTATIEEEFDFQAGDIIAVLATPDDGWWQGVLLDDARRQPGRTVFPSNFVCLF